MARVLGIGGVFFKSRDPAKLAKWYEKWLGFEVDPSFNGVAFDPRSLPQEARAVWGPFAQNTRYFNPSRKSYMINLIVDDVAEALSQVARGGGRITGEEEELEWGTFGSFMDPEGNKIELWRPK